MKNASVKHCSDMEIIAKCFHDTAIFFNYKNFHDNSMLMWVLQEFSFQNSIGDHQVVETAFLRQLREVHSRSQGMRSVLRIT